MTLIEQYETDRVAAILIADWQASDGAPLSDTLRRYCRAQVDGVRLLLKAYGVGMTLLREVDTKQAFDDLESRLVKLARNDGVPECLLDLPTLAHDS